MPVLKDLEIGVMFWAKPDALATLREVKEFGVRCGQLGIPGDLSLDPKAWSDALKKEDFHIATAFCSYIGESYDDIPTVERTVGFVPAATRALRESRTKEVSDFAAAIGVPSVACHAGFVPHTDQSDYGPLRDLVRRICDHAAGNEQTFVLETGQEPAAALLRFLDDVDRPNLGINFDPANMILYGTGDPIEALEVLSTKVLSVHAKDGTWPPKDVAEALGVEQPLGEGAVGIDVFIAKLKQLGYKGTINVEREVHDPEERKRDIAQGIALLRRLIG